MDPLQEIVMRQAQARIETALAQTLARVQQRGAPPRLGAAVRHAVLPGGARIRPLLCLSVAQACGDRFPALSTAAAVAIELIHCASLVHDDLPCFDDATMRRGLASVHTAYGERIAVLTGDALIVLAFETLAAGAACTVSPSAGDDAAPATEALRALPTLTAILAQRTGMPGGITAGQAWECEDSVVLPDYQRAKTGSLFAAATEMGAVAAGAEAAPWRAFGERLGEAYQVADDIRDAAGDLQRLGKPAQRDAALGRPSAVAAIGLAGAIDHFERLLVHAQAAVPDSTGAAALRALVQSESNRLLPADLREHALAVA
ncbi:MAG: polyprenyl synthetase family protein [Rubrivivax sp.]|nr:polyprenyl synthetase family protein [Rubrivivax sp.]